MGGKLKGGRIIGTHPDTYYTSPIVTGRGVVSFYLCYRFNSSSLYLRMCEITTYCFVNRNISFSFVAFETESYTFLSVVQWVPTTSTEAMWYGTAQWLGVTSQSALTYVLPNLPSFGCKLFSETDLFEDGECPSLF